MSEHMTDAQTEAKVLELEESLQASRATVQVLTVEVAQVRVAAKVLRDQLEVASHFQANASRVEVELKLTRAQVRALKTELYGLTETNQALREASK